MNNTQCLYQVASIPLENSHSKAYQTQFALTTACVKVYDIRHSLLIDKRSSDATLQCYQPETACQTDLS